MNAPQHLPPGSEVPGWVEALDARIFGKAWGPLDATGHLLVLEPLAFIRWCIIPAAGEAELVRIGVSEDARRRGLARRLMEASEHLLAQHGIATAYLEVRHSNHPARALYEAMGWQPQRVRTSYYQDGEDAVIYGRML